ncbi:MAG: YqaJ viral recombinase family protein [archaeon]|nr:YqaJ viral recombinase family protein [archaeon]
MDGRKNIIEVNYDEKVIYFETWKPKKISGTKIGGILGYSEFATPFKVACEIARIYPGDKANKYTEFGNMLEPLLRNYIGQNATNMLSDVLNVPKKSKIAIELPIEKERCQYDHFHNCKLFGGMVDGYVLVDGKRAAILEIKTSHDKTKWVNENGQFPDVPMTYQLQASLYAELAGLNKIIFLIGFLEESYITRPTAWRPSEENTFIIPLNKLEMSKPMTKAEEWYRKFILNGCTPKWDDEKDADLLKYLGIMK